MTRRWQRGDLTHPGRVWSFLAKVRWLDESEVKDQTLALALTSASGHFFGRAEQGSARDRSIEVASGHG